MSIDFNKIYLFLSGRLSQEDSASFESEVGTKPELSREVERMEKLFMLTEQFTRQREIRTRSNWMKLSSRIARRHTFARIAGFSRTAAAILFFPLLGMFIYQLQRPAEDAAWIEQTCANGLISELQLPDGSHVWLNSGSKLAYPAVFRGNERRVRLEGEAYFSVTSDESHRFDVELPGGACVSAYGTQFNINTFARQPEVVLAEGRVAVSPQPDLYPTYLQPGQMALLDPESRNIMVTTANVYAKSAWRDGKIVFRRERMEDVADRLSRHFNVDIEIEGAEIEEYAYSATFTTETLPEILDLLAKSAPIRWREEPPVQQGNLSYTKRRIIISKAPPYFNR